MPQLLFDLGNTRVKWVLRDAAGIGEIAALVHADPDWPTTLAAALQPLPTPVSIAVAAVAPELVVAAVLQVLAARWPGIEPRRAVSGARLGRFESAYAQPERMGVDRFLASAAAALQPRAALVIGCGTALTIDLVDAAGRHAGGLIAPAPETMRAAVLSRTARVHWLREGRAEDFGRNTEDALEGGVWMAAAGMVERAARKAEQRLGVAPAMIAHGGSAPLLARVLGTPLAIDALLVMKGLALWIDEP